MGDYKFILTAFKNKIKTNILLIIFTYYLKKNTNSDDFY